MIPVAASYASVFRVRAGFGFIDHFGNDTVIIRDRANPDVQFPIKFIKPPENIINYKYRNWTYLDNSETKVLVCKNSRPNDGYLSQPDSERQIGHTYPRNSRVFA